VKLEVSCGANIATLTRRFTRSRRPAGRIQLTLRRLKKQKLALKDADHARIEDQLIPDIIA
jgi:hypothetical protein